MLNHLALALVLRLAALGLIGSGEALDLVETEGVLTALAVSKGVSLASTPSRSFSVIVNLGQHLLQHLQ